MRYATVTIVGLRVVKERLSTIVDSAKNFFVPGVKIIIRNLRWHAITKWHKYLDQKKDLLLELQMWSMNVNPVNNPENVRKQTIIVNNAWSIYAVHVYSSIRGLRYLRLIQYGILRLLYLKSFQGCLSENTLCRLMMVYSRSPTPWRLAHLQQISWLPG